MKSDLATVAEYIQIYKNVRGRKWARFLIQGGNQLVMFVVYGLLLQLWK